jgi:hypothetical protein
MPGLAGGRLAFGDGCAARVRWLVPAALVAAATLSTATAAQGGAAASETAPHVWLDAKGKPLPFQTNAEIEAFLRTAQVVGEKKLKGGVNPDKRQLVLEENGTQARAIFRFGDIQKKDVRIGARYYFDFRDSYRHECAAYVLARWLGLDSVPPAVPREIDGKEGSLQIWVEHTLDEESDKFAPPDVRAWITQVWEKELFDNLILNVDRTAENFLVGQQYHLWLIDHTRAFQPMSDLLAPEKVKRVKRTAWDRLKGATNDDLQELLGDYLDARQRSALVERRDLLVEQIDGLIAERGEGAVLY